MSDLPPIFRSLFESRAGRDEKIIAAAQKGSVQTLKDYFHVHRGRSHAEGSQLQILRQMIYSPGQFHRKAEEVEVILNASFDAFKFFKTIETSYPQFETELWKFYARDPKEETAQAGGMLMAEYIRYRLCTGTDIYRLPVESLFPDDASLKNAHGTVSTKYSVLQIQNALVDHVLEQGPQLPLNRGGGMLFIMHDWGNAELWLKKITDISVKNKYSAQKGDVRTFNIDYGPA